MASASSAPTVRTPISGAALARTAGRSDPAQSTTCCSAIRRSPCLVGTPVLPFRFRTTARTRLRFNAARRGGQVILRASQDGLVVASGRYRGGKTAAWLVFPGFRGDLCFYAHNHPAYP